MTKQRKQHPMLARLARLKCVWSTQVGVWITIAICMMVSFTLHASRTSTQYQNQRKLLIAPRSVTPIALAVKYYLGRITQGDYEFS